MICPGCQRANEPNSHFCESCGARLDRTCTGCGATLSETARFCRDCGAPTEAVETAAATTPSAPAAPTESAGERRQLTVMFCDLVGSTELGQRLDPEELREALTAYQDACVKGVKRYDGHIAQYLGDGVLVYFGYPRAHEDDAERAVRAALAIQAELVETNQRRSAAGAVEISARVGIHTGLVVVSEIGEEGRHQPLALGDTTNVAARIQEAAESGGVVVSHTTLRLVSGLFVTRDLGTPDLKGVGESVGVHRVERGAGVGRRGVSPHPTRLVGREQELGQFRDRWEQVLEGHGQVLVISGDAGIGKSRLLQGLREQLAHAPHTWLEVRCSPYTSGSAFQPLIELFELGLGFRDEDSAQDRLDKLEAGLAALPGLSLEHTVPYLAALMGLAGSARYPLQNMGPEVQRERTFQALTALILALEPQQPVLVVFEDLHWSDPSTLELVGRLIDEAPTLRVLFVLTFRPSFEPPWSLARSYVSPLTLQRLAKRHTRELVEGAVGGGRLPAPVLEEIVSRADGVPLFAEELARSVVDSGLVVEKDGRYEVRGRLSDLSIPTTLQGSLMARLDRLSAAKQVAQLGATLGREFSYGLIEAVADVDVPILRSGLAQLVEAEILYQRGTPPESTYTFKHALLQDTAYESQLKSRRRELHARTAGILEERFPQRIAGEPEVMARHCAQGGLAPQAITYYQQAGEQALVRLSNEEAAEYFSRGLELMATLPEDDARHQQEIGLRLALMGPLTALRGYEDASVLASIERVEVLCEALGSGPGQLAALTGLSVYHMTRGDLPRARGHADALLRIAEPLSIAPLQVAGHIILGTAALTAVTVPEACEHVRKGIDLAATTELPPPVAAHDVDVPSVAYSVHAIALVLAGRPEQSIASMEESLQRARGCHHLNTLGSAFLNAAINSYFLDDPERSRREAEACLAEVRDLGFHTLESSSLVFRGWARTELGEPEGVADVEEGLARTLTSGSMGGLVQLYFTGADALRVVRDYERAAELVDGAARMIERTGERAAFEPQLPMMRAQLLLEGAGSFAEAERLLLASVEGFRAFQSPWMELRSVLLLARIAIQTGNTETARSRLAELCAGFSEGFEIGRLREARSLLGELAGT